MVAGRNEKGQFTKGNPGGPGRPRREVEARNLQLFWATVSDEDWQAVVAAMIKQAKRGNVAAAQWLGNYHMGKPQDSVDITSNGDKLNFNVKWGDGSDSE